MTHKRVEREGERDIEMMMNLKTTYIVHVNKNFYFLFTPKQKQQQHQNKYKKYLRIMRFDLQASCNSQDVFLNAFRYQQQRRR